LYNYHYSSRIAWDENHVGIYLKPNP